MNAPAPLTADEVVAALGLVELPVEGGYFAQGYRSEDLSTIYYLLRDGEFSAVHRLSGVEVYAHHAGAPLRFLLLHPDGTVTRPVLGSDLGAGERPQLVVPAGVWQGREPVGGWALVTTVVVPPYTDEGVEFGEGELGEAYPGYGAEVRRLCGVVEG